MATSTKPSIHERMAAILAGLPAIGKDSYNQGLKFNFRSVDAILNELNPLLEKHGVFIVPRVIDVRTEALQPKGRMAVVTVEYRYVADDGSEVVAVSAGEGHDFGDKSVSKAMTMALKTCLAQTFAIATAEEDPDGDAVQAEQSSAASGGASPQRKARPAEAAKQDGAPPPPPAGWEKTKTKIDNFFAVGTAGADARMEQFKVATVKAGLRAGVNDAMDLAQMTKEQLATVDDILDGITEPFSHGHR